MAFSLNTLRESWRSKAQARERAAQLYLQAVQQSRTPALYRDYRVPDTLDGRFEMILLHTFLLARHLRGGATPACEEMARLLTEIFIDDMDRSLREMGVTDTGVGKRVKRMAAAYYGRFLAYGNAIDDPAALEAALARNVYGGAGEDASALAAYMRTVGTALAGAEAETCADLGTPVPELSWR